MDKNIYKNIIEMKKALELTNIFNFHQYHNNSCNFFFFFLNF